MDLKINFGRIFLLNKSNIMNTLELEFINELKRLNLRRLDVADHLGFSYETLKRKLQDPGRFKLVELKKLKELNINLKLLNYE